MSPRAVTLAGYAAIASGAVVYQSVSWVRHSLTLGRLVRWLMRGRAGRALFLLGWAWRGWHLFAPRQRDVSAVTTRMLRRSGPDDSTPPA